MGGGDDEELQATITKAKIEKKTWGQSSIGNWRCSSWNYWICDSIEVKKLVVVFAKVSQLIQLIVEHVN
jgi:hypothetical protein